MREVDGGGATSSGSSAFFNRAASQTLQRLILAAAVSGRSLRDVASWIATRSPEPVGLLGDHGFTELAEDHEADLEGPVETRGGIYATVAAAVSCLNVETVARWITPPTTWRQPPTEPIAEFDPWTLVASEVGGRTPPCTCSPARAPAPPGSWWPRWWTGSSRSPGSPPPPAGAGSTRRSR
jgi:type IV secretion system protein VirD4